jgi:hypothetical protein
VIPRRHRHLMLPIEPPVADSCHNAFEGTALCLSENTRICVTIKSSLFVVGF